MFTIVPSGKVSETPDNMSESIREMPDTDSSAVTGRNIEPVSRDTGPLGKDLRWHSWIFAFAS